jgi:hypothetical protein
MAFFPAILHDLQIDVIPRSFLAEEHGGLRAVFRVATMIISVSPMYCQYPARFYGTMNTAPGLLSLGKTAIYHEKIPVYC